MRTIEIENIGPIEKLTIPLPEDGGVVVLRGVNGCGKSTALDAARSLMSGKGSLPVRDACSAGHVNGLGVTIRVGKSTRRGGELEALHLEDRLSIADLVDPGLKSEEAADGRRIKALVGLTGAKADPLLFPEVARHDLDRYDDLVEQAGVAKRNLEAMARAEEKLADELLAKARAMREGLDPKAVQDVDEDALRGSLSRAIRDEATIRERFGQAARRDVEAAQAKKKLEELTTGYSGMSASATLSAVKSAEAKCEAAQKVMDAAKDAYDAAVSEADLADTARVRADDKHKTAVQHQEAVAALQATIDAAKGAEPVDEAAIEVAQAARMAAEKAMTEGLAARGARVKLEGAAVTARESAQHASKAAELREAAKATDDVLADAIQCPVLRIEAGRLVTGTKRGRTLFADLSEGERWRIALDIAADQVGDGGIITVPQDAWEGLDAENRRAIAEHAKRRLVTILTAEAQREGEPEELTAAALAEA
jgi:hypothetical protein